MPWGSVRERKCLRTRSCEPYKRKDSDRFEPTISTCGECEESSQQHGVALVQQQKQVHHRSQNHLKNKRRRKQSRGLTNSIVYYAAAAVIFTIQTKSCAFQPILVVGPKIWTQCVRHTNHLRRSSQRSSTPQNRTEWKDSPVFDFTGHAETVTSSPMNQRPLPLMPSHLFQELAISQLELLACSMPHKDASAAMGSKIQSMILYLPQENSRTGQLEFLPAILYPRPSSERVFIASDSDSGMAPTMPRTMTKLPGFAHATSLLPGYPMVSLTSSSSVSLSDQEVGVGIVEEVVEASGLTALSVPLFSGSQTVGVLLISPMLSSQQKRQHLQQHTILQKESFWTVSDRKQVAMAARSISLALSMDNERNAMREQNRKVQAALSDSLHQFKNPLQALRTYGKILQQRMADSYQCVDGSVGTMTPQLLELAEHLIVQSDRLVERLKPVDAIVDSIGRESRRPMLMPVEAKALVLRKNLPLSWEEDTLNFAREMMPPQNTTGLKMPSRNELNQRTYRSLTKNRSLESNRLGNTESEMLKISKAPSLLGEMILEMSFVSDVLEPVFESFNVIATERGIQFSIQVGEDLPGVTIWSQALQESVINVLDNAFKYVMLEPSQIVGPQVRVRVLPNQQENCDDSGVTILIEDNGPGIPIEERESVFERGVRGIQAQTMAGSGIGLDIARSLVQQMGGTLQIVENDRYPHSLPGALLELIVYRNRREHGTG